MKQNPNNSAKISLKSIPKPECRIPESFWQITEEDYENMESEYDILYETCAGKNTRTFQRRKS